MSLDASRLAPVGPIAMLDRAFSLVREAGLRSAARAWCGGALLAAALIGVYYVERVEGVATLRPALAVVVVLAWWGRAVLLGDVAREMSGALFDAAPEAGGVGARTSAFDVLRTAIVAGAGLWTWSWLLVLGSLGGALGVGLVFPLLALRGASAPSWLARASARPEAGFASFVRALADTRGRRAAAVGVELALSLGALALAANLYAATLAAVMLLHSFLGLEVATVSSFLSLSNVFVQLVVAASALVLLEPLRAAVSAASFVDARVRADGLDLRAAVERALAHRAPRAARGSSGAARAAALGLGLVLGAAAMPGHAQPPASAQDLADDAVQDDLGEILARPEFREFEDHRSAGVTDLLDRLLDWLMQREDPLEGVHGPDVSALALPGPIVFLCIAGLLVLGVGVYLWVTRRREQSEAQEAAVAARVAVDLRERPPETFLDEAARLAEAGQLREALRALYLATLVSLDRRRLISFDPHRTNWQYLRDMPRSEIRSAFRQFTRLFDHKWYGREPTSGDDYERCRALAQGIVAGSDA